MRFGAGGNNHRAGLNWGAGCQLNGEFTIGGALHVGHFVGMMGDHLVADVGFKEMHRFQTPDRRWVVLAIESKIIAGFATKGRRDQDWLELKARCISRSG